MTLRDSLEDEQRLRWHAIRMGLGKRVETRNHAVTCMAFTADEVARAAVALDARDAKRAADPRLRSRDRANQAAYRERNRQVRAAPGREQRRAERIEAWAREYLDDCRAPTLEQARRLARAALENDDARLDVPQPSEEWRRQFVARQLAKRKVRQ